MGPKTNPAVWSCYQISVALRHFLENPMINKTSTGIDVVFSAIEVQAKGSFFRTLMDVANDFLAGAWKQSNWRYFC